MADMDKIAVWFAHMQEKLCTLFEGLEEEAPIVKTSAPARFEKKKWRREAGGGGQMAMIRNGKLIEKGGVHFSDVFGAMPEALMAEDPKRAGGRFRASGVSVIIHTLNPHCPTAHMNSRFIEMTDEKGQKQFWFGGGCDLTPMLPAYRSQTHQDSLDFHNAFEKACAQYDQINYQELKQWCHRYFRLPHRQNQERGIGGVFYDRLNSGDFDSDFAFAKAIGECFIEIYPKLLRRHMSKAWNEEDRHTQAIYRGLYAEFNLLYDRGTEFGLKSGGNIESILSSLPPKAVWK